MIRITRPFDCLPQQRRGPKTGRKQSKKPQEFPPCASRQSSAAPDRLEKPTARELPLERIAAPHQKAQKTAGAQVAAVFRLETPTKHSRVCLPRIPRRRVFPILALGKLGVPMTTVMPSWPEIEAITHPVRTASQPPHRMPPADRPREAAPASLPTRALRENQKASNLEAPSGSWIKGLALIEREKMQALPSSTSRALCCIRSYSSRINRICTLA